jgi:RNA-directed DNA polymerase
VKTEDGCLQGVFLSPLQLNIMLNKLDKELERKKVKFYRYAD